MRAEMLMDAVTLQIVVQLMIDDVGGQHQRQFPQLRQLLPASLRVKLLFRRALDRFFRRRIHDFDFVGALDERKPARSALRVCR